MNKKMILKIIGKTMIVEAVLLLFPMALGFIYNDDNYIAFLLPIAFLFVVGLPLSLLKSQVKSIYAKEGFVIVALCWILLSVVGAFPFYISGDIPNYIDALFETISGFSTTGASILEDVSVLSKSMMFWRILTHWLGGMGVLVFVLAILPNDSNGGMYIFRAESPGPSSTKLVGNIKKTARILYCIYVALTLLETVMLLFSGIGVYDSVLNAFSTAGTGGFSVRNGSIAYYENTYVEMVIAVFMFLFGINFNLFYLAIVGNVVKALKSEELRAYIIIVVVATITIALNLLSTVDNFATALRYSFFQVTSITSTTGFTTATIEEWPALSKGVLLFLTIVGACGGSTGGGMKVARLMILVKSSSASIRRMVNPRSIITVRYEGKPLSNEVESNVCTYFITYFIILIISTLILSLDKFSGGDIFTNISATLACLGNVGPGLTKTIGALGNYSGYSWVSKIVLSLAMLAGRLEIFPMLILFAPRTWKKS